MPRVISAGASRWALSCERHAVRRLLRRRSGICPLHLHLNFRSLTLSPLVRSGPGAWRTSTPLPRARITMASPSPPSWSRPADGGRTGPRSQSAGMPVLTLPCPRSDQAGSSLKPSSPSEYSDSCRVTRQSLPPRRTGPTPPAPPRRGGQSAVQVSAWCKHWPSDASFEAQGVRAAGRGGSRAAHDRRP